MITLTPDEKNVLGIIENFYREFPNDTYLKKDELIQLFKDNFLNVESGLIAYNTLLSRGVFEERDHNNEVVILLTALYVKDIYQDEYVAVLSDICEGLRKNGYDKETIERYMVSFCRSLTNNYLNNFQETDDYS
jgi:hypothetical protein